MPDPLNPQPSSGLGQDPLAMSSQLDDLRNQARRNRTQPLNGNSASVPAQPAQPRKSDQKTKWQIDKDYPHPISTNRFLIFGAIAVGQDVLQALLDFLGVGWLAGYITLPLVWFLYWYLIIRWAPKSVKPRLWKRSAFVGGLEIIPIIGEILPGWTITAFMAYRMIKNYTEGKEDSTLEKGVEKLGSNKLTNKATSAITEKIPGAS